MLNITSSGEINFNNKNANINFNLSPTSVSFSIDSFWFMISRNRVNSKINEECCIKFHIGNFKLNFYTPYIFTPLDIRGTLQPTLELA